MTPEESIQKFIARQIGIVFEDASVSRFELLHASPESAERLQMLPFVPQETRTDELATELYELAQADAKARCSATPERYGITAHVEGQAEPVAQMSFVIAPTARFGSLFENSEEPNQKGQTSQLMRHTERMHQMMLQMTDVTLGRLMAENLQLRGELDKYRARENETRELYDAALDAKEERELRQASALMKAKRIDQMGGLLVSMAPALLASLFKSKGLPLAADSVGASAIKQFMGELSEAEMKGILSALSPTHQMALIEVYRSMRADSVEEDKDKPAILRASESAA